MPQRKAIGNLSNVPHLFPTVSLFGTFDIIKICDLYNTCMWIPIKNYTIIKNTVSTKSGWNTKKNCYTVKPVHVKRRYNELYLTSNFSEIPVKISCISHYIF